MMLASWMPMPPARFCPSATSAPIPSENASVRNVAPFGVSGVCASAAASGRLSRRFRWRETMPSFMVVAGRRSLVRGVAGTDHRPPTTDHPRRSAPYPAFNPPSVSPTSSPMNPRHTTASNPIVFHMRASVLVIAG